MTTTELLNYATQLEQQILAAPDTGRLSFQPRLREVLRSMRQNGAEIPSRLRRLDVMLEEQAAEQMFDNMPV